MANTVVINGDKRKFTLSSDLKLYALIDAGFVKTPRVTSIMNIPFTMIHLIMHLLS